MHCIRQTPQPSLEPTVASAPASCVFVNMHLHGTHPTDSITCLQTAFAAHSLRSNKLRELESHGNFLHYSQSAPLQHRNTLNVRSVGKHVTSLNLLESVACLVPCAQPSNISSLSCWIAANIHNGSGPRGKQELDQLQGHASSCWVCNARDQV